MSSLRGQKLTCFYCGSWSAQKRTRSLRKWRCEKCEAENYLDSHGNFTEPPVASSSTPKQSVRYASPVRNPGISAAPSDEIFCQTCIKNQTIVNELLSSYIPDEESPDYEKYSNSYDAYRAEVEQRYPQICAFCAPRARERIKRAGYVAKTDHLRRMIDLTKQRGVLEPTPGSWKKIIIQMGGLGWWSGPILQSLWHALSVASIMHVHGQGPIQHCSSFGDAFSDDTMTTCVRELRTLGLFTTPCARALEPFVISSFGVTLLTSWWNNKLLSRRFQAGARLLHIKQHFIFQLAVFALRFTAFYILTRFSRLLETPEKIAAHSISAALIIIFSLVALSIVKIDNTPRVSFHVADDQILPDVPKLQPHQVQISPPAMKNRSSEQTGSFPFHKLAPPRTELPPPTFAVPRPQIPTPPPEPEPEYDPDAMEIDSIPPSPAQHAAYNLRPRAMPQPMQNTGPSPFQTRIPPAPVPPAYKLRNPNFNQPSNPFTRAQQSQENTFASFSTSNMYSTANQTRSRRGRASSVNTDDSSLADPREMRDEGGETDAWGLPVIHETPRRSGPVDMQLAPPRFFAEQDRKDTGLENIFQDAFRLGDTPKMEKIAGSVRPQAARLVPAMPRGLTGSFTVAAEREASDGGSTAEERQKSRWIDFLLAIVLAATFLGIAFAAVKVLRG